MLDLTVNGYYVIRPEYEVWSQCHLTLTDKEPSIEDMQRIVGGYIEHVGLRAADGVVNEEGKLHELPVNALASELYDNPQDLIVGNMLVLCGKARMK